MSTKDNTLNTSKKQYHHLTKEQRIKFQTLRELKDEHGKRIYNDTQIAEILGVHKSTICRENKRTKSKINVVTGKIKNLPYSAERAHEDYLFNRAFSKAHYILDDYPKMRKYIESKIKVDGWAPDVIVGYMNKNKMYLEEGFTSISVPTIYRAIHYGIIDVKKEDTRRMTKFEKQGRDCIKKEVPENKREHSIELRSDKINNRETFGHWELDTVISSSKGNYNCLMTITERKTRYEIIVRLTAKSKDEVVNKFKIIKNHLKENINKIMKSITTDNGTEFSRFEDIIKITGADLYFCHPYASCEKGTNEKHNGIIRYFIPKGSIIDNYSNKELNNICSWMNNYPRKILGYMTPLEALTEELGNEKIVDKIINLQSVINPS